MCGLVGVVDLKKRDADADLVACMTRTLAHRGPNDEGIYTSGHVGLGHRRLSILDLSQAGHQPMKGRNGTAHIVFNGEIYNYIELQKELGGAFVSSSDTEVLLAAYEKWGEGMLGRLNGIFGFIIWDEKKKKIFAARDRFGVKPLYYTVHENKLYLASEIKAFFEAGVPAVPNDAIIYDYLVYGFYEHASETFFRDIYQVPPGHYLTLHDKEVQIEKYYSLPDNVQDLEGLGDEELASQYKDLVMDAVRIQMRSDVPIGLPASGGLDCSILTRAVHDINGGQKNFELFTFTYGDPKFDETPYVQALADGLGWSVTFFELDPKLTLELLPDVLRAEEQPFPGVSIIARHNMYRRADKRSIVMLEGHGGDELGAGYQYYFGNFIQDLKEQGLAKEAEGEIEAYAKLHDISVDEAKRHVARGIESFEKGGVSADASRFADTAYLGKEFLKKSRKPLPDIPRPFQDRLANIQYRDVLYTKEPRVLRSVDRNSMAYGREVRVPFLDHRIAEFAFSLSPMQKIRNAEQRFFMREAFRDSLPPHIVNAPKRSVPDPQRDWLKGPLRDWARDIIASDSFGKRPYFDQEACLEAFDTFCTDPKANNSFHIWQMLNLELWFRMYIDRV